jgi:DNA polymerase V
MRLVSLIDCNNFYVSCERLFNLKLRKQPVIVLSNNDGCVVSRSQEAKDLGIQMGVPYFQIQEKVERLGIKVLSSNYTLYADISSRVMDAVGHFSPAIEFYSIDEAFAVLEQNKHLPDVYKAGVEMRSKVYKWTGIPTSIGIAPTKTLAKIAGKNAKKSENGVFELISKDSQDAILEETEIADIWGINLGLAKRLYELRIRNARQFRDLDLRIARKILTVVGARLVLELRGISCLPLEYVQPLKKNITCSRSFAGFVLDESELIEAVVYFLSTAAEKMRKQNLTAKVVQVFVQTDHFRDEPQYNNTATFKFANSTDSTRELLDAALSCLRAIYRLGYRYRKAGVNLLGLQPAAAETRRLFDDETYVRDKALMKIIDFFNLKYGHGTIGFGLHAQDHDRWQMKRERLSPNYTTSFGDILQVKM